MARSSCWSWGAEYWMASGYCNLKGHTEKQLHLKSFFNHLSKIQTHTYTKYAHKLPDTPPCIQLSNTEWLKKQVWTISESKKIRSHSSWNLAYVTFMIFMFSLIITSIPQLQGLLGHHKWFCPFVPVLHCPLGLGELQACPFPDVVFPPLPLSALSSSPLSLCLARWFWPDLMNGRHDHTTAVCVSLRSSDLRVVQLPSASWDGLPRW